MPLETVFVYGSLKRGFINHHVMAGTEFLGAGVTQPGFAMLGLGRYPGVVRGTAVIAGEVFAVPAPRMGRLDRLEDNGRVYRREVTPIRLPSGVVDAWIYLYLLARGHEKPVKPRGNVVTWRENSGRENLALQEWRWAWPHASGRLLAMFPTALTSARLLLRPVVMDDAPAIFDGYAQDPEVSRYLLWRPHTRLEDTQAYLSACVAATDFRTYAIVDRTRGALIGAFDLRRQAPWRMGFGYVLARSAWGRGLMTEALTEVVGWALAQPGIWRIGDLVDTGNIASARVMEKVGLQREGLLRRFGVHPNVSDEPRDCYIYGKVRSAA